MSSKYLDFDLRIWREGDRYIAEVRDSPAGASDREVLQWPFGHEPHEVLRLKLENAVLKARGFRGGPLSAEERVLREFGSDVFRAVLRNSGSIALKFAASLDIVKQGGDELAGLRLKLRVDPPELSMLPWEYMFDPNARDNDALQNYVCLRNRSPLVRFVEVDGPQSALRVNGPLRILGMVANPGGEWERLDTEAERHRIAEALKDAPKGSVHFEWVHGGSPDDLFDFIQRGAWHVFHFIGHGGTEVYTDAEGGTRTEGYVVMQDGLGGAVRVSASHLGLMLEGNGSLRLAVLNCCESASGGPFTSAGASLVNSGVPLAVAMQFPISNGAATRFAGQFYKSVIAGQPVERALTTARQFMRNESNVEWGIPVLFTRSGPCVLFEIEPRDQAAVPLPATATASPVRPRNASAQEELRRLFG